MLFISKGGSSMVRTFTLLLIVLVLTPLIVVPVATNTRRKRRGEEPHHGPLAITMTISLMIAALVAMVGSISTGGGWWGGVLSGFSFVATWIGLVVMLARGTPRPSAVSSRHHGYEPTLPSEFGSQDGADSKPSHPSVSWLEITAQISGILSLVVAVIALFKR